MAVSEENSCTFYASDYHLEMIMLPYINENLTQNKNIYVFTQNNLEDTINTLVDNVNLENKTKQNILNINWKNEDENKYKKLIEDNKESVIFVKGNKDYINKVNNNLEQMKKIKKMEVVDCYNLADVKNNANDISKRYKSILFTNGKRCY